VIIMAKAHPTTPERGFTPAFLDNIKPQPKLYELADSAKPGLRLRVEPSGARTFVWYYKDGPKTKVLTLGRYGSGEGCISLKAARDKLDMAKERHRDGERPERPANAPKTVSELAEIFYERRILPHRTRPDVVRAILDNDVIPKMGARKLQTLTAPTVAALVESVVDRGAAAHAGKVLAVTKQLFKFAESRGYIDRSPAYALDRKDLGVVDNIRERHLDAGEIRAVWRALNLAPRMSVQMHNGLKILLLTGVRTGELLKAQWEHIDLDKGEWFIPEENSKTTAWTVPLVPAVVKLFRELQDVAGKSPWVMPSTSEKSKTGRIDEKAPGHAFRRLFEVKIKDHETGEKVPLLAIPPCSPHDFRRTLRTHMDDLKMVDPETGIRLSIPPHIAEKCLNHSLGRIERTYNKNTLLKQRRAALEAWADYVDLVVHDRGNVAVIGGAS
jgi:integrase